MMKEHQDRVAEHEDWRDGMNKFRSNLVAILQEMDQRLKKLEEKINV